MSEIIKPKFSITDADLRFKTMIAIQAGICGYEKPILEDISLSVGSQERIAIVGDNGSGTTPLLKAILNDSTVIKSGYWLVPNHEDMGYLDQHYKTHKPQKTVLGTLQSLAPAWSHAKTRDPLNDFLFRKNEEVHAPVKTLSRREKVRLSLAQIAAKTTKLLILDEITNNLDLETRDVSQVLKEYPGALIVISHDEDFLRAINVSIFYDIENQTLTTRI